MKFPAKLLSALAAILLTSCAGDVMQVMAEEKKPVGVLVIRPAAVQPVASHLGAAGPTYVAVKDEVDPSLSSRFGVYDNGQKTFRKYGQTVVAKLRAQGIDARLLDSYPPHESLIKDTPLFARIKSYPAETKKYSRCLILHEATVMNLGSAAVSGGTMVNARLIDTATNATLGAGTGYDFQRATSYTTRQQAHAVLDETSRKARQSMLDETFYQYEE
jgi:hypothetical protein